MVVLGCGRAVVGRGAPPYLLKNAASSDMLTAMGRLAIRASADALSEVGFHHCGRMTVAYHCDDERRRSQCEE